jgi:hypothetical protein
VSPRWPTSACARASQPVIGHVRGCPPADHFCPSETIGTPLLPVYLSAVKLVFACPIKATSKYTMCNSNTMPRSSRSSLERVLAGEHHLKCGSHRNRRHPPSHIFIPRRLPYLLVRALPWTSSCHLPRQTPPLPIGSWSKSPAAAHRILVQIAGRLASSGSKPLM